MAIFKIRGTARKNYTIVDNFCIQDANLSYAETGLMTYLLHLPANWEINQRQIESAKTDGRDKVRSLFKSLIKKGYLVKKEERDERGKFAVEYDVYERPTQLDFKVIHSNDNRDGFTDAVQPSTANRPQQNTITKLVKENNNTNTHPAHVCEGSTHSKPVKRSRVELFDVVTRLYSSFVELLELNARYQEPGNEVLNIIVDMLYYAEHSGFYKANGKHYTLPELAALFVKIDDEHLETIVKSIVAFADKIENRDRYIMAAILKQAESSKKKATTDTRLLEVSPGSYTKNYLGAANNG